MRRRRAAPRPLRRVPVAPLVYVSIKKQTTRRVPVDCILLGVDSMAEKGHGYGMKPEKPEFTEEQRAYFRECGRRGGLARTVTEKSREASRRSMTRYWEEVRAGKRYHRPIRKPKQAELPLEREE